MHTSLHTFGRSYMSIVEGPADEASWLSLTYSLALYLRLVHFELLRLEPLR